MINAKQRAFLRSMANTVDPILHVGKEGITENLLRQGDEALNARELVKGTVMENSPVIAKEALESLCVSLRAEPVQSIGRRFVLYRRNHDRPRIVLPQ
jgi:RNA-binding protein